MASEAEKAECVLWFHKSRSAVTAQRRFRAVFGREPPTKMSIYKWYKLLDQTACICKGKGPRRRSVTEAQTDTVHAASVRSPRKSTSHAARILNILHTKVHKILRKRLKFKSYKYQLLQHVIAKAKKFAMHFALSFFQEFKTNFYSQTVFSDEATFSFFWKC
jgi:hypothetical protein